MKDNVSDGDLVDDRNAEIANHGARQPCEKSYGGRDVEAQVMTATSSSLK